MGPRTRWVIGLGCLAGFGLLVWSPSPAQAGAGDEAAPSGRARPQATAGLLSPVERLAPEIALGPEDLAFGPDGALYAGIEGGRLLRNPASGGPATTLAHTGGRPLGLAFDRQGRLLVADAQRGLLAVGAGGRVTVLADGEGGLPFRFTNGVAVGPSGAVYFTDSSSQRGPDGLYPEMLEGRPHGRLLRYDPATGAVARLLDGLYFANGVAVGPDESYLLVAETFAYRVTRYWLEGPRAGQTDTFVDNLPGFPDGISYNGDGVFWLALFAPRSALLDAFNDWPLVRGLLARLPAWLLPTPGRYAHVLGLDTDGRVVHDLRDPAGTYAPISSARQHREWLYLGSLTERGIGRVALPGAAINARTLATARE